MIVNLEASYFKGLRWFSITPKNVNLIIGANGTGKTNFADLIDFLSLTCRFGLKEAFERHGGLDEVRTKLPGGGRPPALKCAIVLDRDNYRGIEQGKYSFTLSASKGLVVDEEELDTVIYARSVGRPSSSERVKFDKSKKISLRFKRKKETIEAWSEDSLGLNPRIFEDEQNLILNAYGKLSNFRTISDYLSAMRVYNIDSTLAKQSSNGNDIELERSGSNLISFLKRVLVDEGAKEKLLNDLRYAVPYIKDIVPEKILNYTTLRFSEVDSKLDFRAQQMSDGTIRLLGLLALLRQTLPPPLVVIEEPENALHSYAVRTLLRIAMEVSALDRLPTQVFLTSHSPAVVDEVLGLEPQQTTATAGFVAKRKKGAGTIEPVSISIIKAISKNIGRPSDFLREGSFEDGPVQLEMEFGKQ